MGIFSSLTRSQKEAIGLLQIGTFLEYFDLMLYVHMAVLLNELFFPKTDPHTAALLSAFAFCSTYVLRPFGALLFGYIGDTIGRKTTVIITTMMMSTSCIIMANLPTYAQVGIAAAWLVTGCRIIQGLSSMGEIIGAEIYVTEITKPPAQYPAVSMIDIAAYVGAAVAIGISALVTSCNLNWRIAFWIGAGIAVVGSIARTRLRETPEFIDMKTKIKNAIEERSTDEGEKKQQIKGMQWFISQEKISSKTIIAFFLIYCGWPLSFYLVYMHFNPLLKNIFKYSAEDIILHNFWLSLVHCGVFLLWGLLSYKVNPLKISKIKGIIFLIFTISMPSLLFITKTSTEIFLIQTILLILSLSALPANAIFIKHFPVLKRFTATSFLYALTRAIMYIITSFGLVFLTEWLGHYGLWFIMVPAIIGFIYGVNHFEKLEQLSQHTSEPSQNPPTIRSVA